MSSPFHAALAVALSLLTAIVRAEENAYSAEDALYQLAPTAVLTQGLLEGPTPFHQLLRFGDFGLGGLSPVDGEVILLDGTVYQARYPDGRLREVDPEERTPFMFIKRFGDDLRLQLPPVDSYDDAVRQLDRQLPSPNLIYALRIDGEFDYLKLRSVPPQKRPYPPIDQVVRGQRIYERENIRGTIVAFRFPAYLGSTSGSGYHMHFVDAERKLGGHLLDLRSRVALAVSVDESHGLNLVLPDDAAFKAADFDSRADSSGAFNRAVRPD
ncbi:acetolactate decarboxylase [Microbulbifer taiwanensis]|uniref:Alpha-acetolactate decarboxylase n=1 Tax=Microbulbifer taiwanensis TaxID=986746 RepID=A0ABW1YJ08_9GAMM|nr:acetolactate decarboxylase [Microbulbifer taiwanensis]